MTYTPRQMPARFMENAPAIVKRGVLDIIKIDPPAPLDFDIVLRPESGETELTGLDFGAGGSQGCHFFLNRHEMAAYRARNRRNRVAWSELPEATQRRLVSYLESE